MKLVIGTLYRNKHSLSVMKLKRDYDGRWYLCRKDHHGVLKTLSVSDEKMIELLESSFEKI